VWVGARRVPIEGAYVSTDPALADLARSVELPVLVLSPATVARYRTAGAKALDQHLRPTIETASDPAELLSFDAFPEFKDFVSAEHGLPLVVVGERLRLGNQGERDGVPRAILWVDRTLFVDRDRLGAEQRQATLLEVASRMHEHRLVNLAPLALVEAIRQGTVQARRDQVAAGPIYRPAFSCASKAS
jgi:hypothetical protein